MVGELRSTLWTSVCHIYWKYLIITSVAIVNILAVEQYRALPHVFLVLAVQGNGMGRRYKLSHKEPQEEEVCLYKKHKSQEKCSWLLLSVYHLDTKLGPVFEARPTHVMIRPCEPAVLLPFTPWQVWVFISYSRKHHHWYKSFMQPFVSAVIQQEDDLPLSMWTNSLIEKPLTVAVFELIARHPTLYVCGIWRDRTANVFLASMN